MLPRNNVVYQKVEEFTDRIVKLTAYLQGKNAVRSMVDQLLRAGLSIGANVSEAKYAQSRPDFISKMSIALKEANETKYWIRKFYTAEFLSVKEYESIYSDADEIVAILFSIIRTAKNN